MYSYASLISLIDIYIFNCLYCSLSMKYIWDMEKIRSNSLPCIVSNEHILNESVPNVPEDKSNSFDGKPIYVSPSELKRKIRKRILNSRQNNEKVHNENLKRYEKYNEVKAFKASIVTKDQEIGKLFLVDRKVTYAPPTPDVEASSLQTDVLTTDRRTRKQRPLSLPPAQLPPIYKTKLFPIGPRDLDIKSDIFTPHQSVEESWQELEDCRYLRKPNE